MKRACLFLAVALALFSSCNFNFSDDEDSSPENLRCVTETSSTVQLCAWYDGDALKYYEERYVLAGTENTTRLIDQIQRYSASNDLSWTYRYTYTAAGFPETEAYYDAANALKWYHVFEYDSSGKELLAHYEYDGSSALQWARKYSYVASGGKAKTAVSFNAAGHIDGAVQYWFILDSNS